MHVGAGGTVGQPERAWLPASPRVTRSAPMAWALRARAPVAAGSLPRATRSAPKAGALRARAPTCALRVTAHVVSWGGVGMSKTSCAARCSRGSVQGVLRAPAEGEGGVAHREDLAATASATLERSAGTVAHGKRAARERRRRRSKVSRRRRAGRRAVGGACACRARSNGRRRPLVGGWWWQQVRITSGWLPLIGGSIFAAWGQRVPITTLDAWLGPKLRRKVEAHNRPVMICAVAHHQLNA